MARFRSIPVKVEAEQWDGSDGQADVLASFTHGQFVVLGEDDRALASDLEETAQLFERRGMWRPVYTGDWIVRENGQLYVCRPDAFAVQFEAVPQ